MHTRPVLRYLPVLVLSGAPLLVQADNARDWQNIPIDLNMVFGYYNRIDTNTPIDTALPIDGLSLDADLYILRLARSFSKRQWFVVGLRLGDLGRPDISGLRSYISRSGCVMARRSVY